MREYRLNQIRRYKGQVYRCIQAHSVYPGQEGTHNPLAARALWGIYHGTTVRTAKPYVAPLGTSGIYMKGDCCIWTDGEVYQSLIDNNAWTPAGHPAGWKKLTGAAPEGSEKPPEPPVDEYPPWVQPTGGHDAYKMGDKVTYNGKNWVSTANANVWAPGVYGWEEAKK